MKFIKYLKFDIHQGIFHNRTLIVSPILISVVIFVDFIFRANQYLVYDIIDQSVSYEDYLFYLYGGMTEYIPDYGEVFSFPVVWVAIFLVLPFILLNYPFKDIAGNGQHILTRSTKRSFWWLAKCVWNIGGTLFYHFMIQLTGLVLCFIFRIEITNIVHVDFIKAAFRIRPEEIRDISVLLASAVFLPVCVSVSVNMLQMTLSLFIRPIYSFFSVLLVLIISAYLLLPAGIGNYAMLLRQDWVLLYKGVSVGTGYSISLMLLLLSIVVGSIRFHYYDILENTY